MNVRKRYEIHLGKLGSWSRWISLNIYCNQVYIWHYLYITCIYSHVVQSTFILVHSLLHSVKCLVKNHNIFFKNFLSDFPKVKSWNYDLDKSRDQWYLKNRSTSKMIHSENDPLRKWSPYLPGNKCPEKSLKMSVSNLEIFFWGASW